MKVCAECGVTDPQGPHDHFEGCMSNLESRHDQASEESKRKASTAVMWWWMKQHKN